MKNGKWVFIGSVLALAMSHNGFCAKLYHITGTVNQVDEKSVILNFNGENYEFDRSALSVNTPKNVKPGDSVTIYYSMDAKRISSESRHDQAPGQVADPKQKPSDPSKNGKMKDGVIDDDRTFYGA